jgi:hypothetical protein
MVTSAIGSAPTDPATQWSGGPQMDRILKFVVGYFCEEAPQFSRYGVAPNQLSILLIVTHPNYNHQNIKSYRTSMNYKRTVNIMQHKTVDALGKRVESTVADLMPKPFTYLKTAL